MLGILEDKETSKYYGNHSHHSKFLNTHFKLRNNGYDWDSETGLRVEFKECFQKYNKRFMIRYKDVLHSDIIVCCVASYYFYIVPSKAFNIYNYKSKNAMAQPCLNTIKKLAVASFKNIIRLKEYLNTSEKLKKYLSVNI